MFPTFFLCSFPLLSLSRKVETRTKAEASVNMNLGNALLRTLRERNSALNPSDTSSSLSDSGDMVNDQWKD